jgi:hypothetical protein
MLRTEDPLTTLRKRFQKDSQAAVAEALQGDSPISKDRVEELDRLSRLIALVELSRPKPVRRWIVIVLLGGLIVPLVCSLMFGHVRQTAIDLDLSCSGMSFVTAQQQQILPKDGWELAELGLGGETSTVELPLSADVAEKSITGRYVRMVVPQNTSGTLNAQTLTLPPNTRVYISLLAAEAGRYRLTLQGADPSLVVQLSGPVRLVTGKNSLELETIDSSSVHCGTGECNLDITPTASGLIKFSEIQINDFSLVSMSPPGEDSHAVGQQLSTILSGRVILNALNGKESTLREGDRLQLKNASGVLRVSRSKNDQFDVKFTGNVSDLAIHHGSTSSTLMPTWLEWLQASPHFSLLWGTSMYLFGLLVGIMRWWSKGI